MQGVLMRIIDNKEIAILVCGAGWIRTIDRTIAYRDYPLPLSYCPRYRCFHRPST